MTVEGLSRRRFKATFDSSTCWRKWDARCGKPSRESPLQEGRCAGIDVDMNAISDTAQTLAAVAPFAQGPTTIRNIAHVRHKETDRIAAVATELRRLGQTVEEHADGLTIHPAPILPATVATYDDHRMAMSFALIGLKSPGVRIADPECTRKTYPNYFADLCRLCGIANPTIETETARVREE